VLVPHSRADTSYFHPMVALTSAILVLLSLPGAVQGTQAIIRKEGEGALLIGPEGEFLEQSRQFSKHSSSPKSKYLFEAKTKETDYCREDFPLGKPDTSECNTDNGVSHQLIYRESECEKAAEEHGMTKGRGAELPFVIINAFDQNKHPKGCFKDKDHDAVFFNDIGDMPTMASLGGGTPICHREKYKAGPAGTSTCPTDYVAILDEELCKTFADCRGKCMLSEFRVGVNASSPSADERPTDASNYDNFPKGCFIKSSDNCTYFNVPRDVDPAGPVTGTPMCHPGIATAATASTAGSNVSSL